MQLRCYAVRLIAIWRWHFSALQSMVHAKLTAKAARAKGSIFAVATWHCCFGRLRFELATL